MNNFDLHTPTRILFGKGAIDNLRDQIPADARILVTYGGGSVKKTGVLDQVLNALNGFDVLEFGGIEPNPRNLRQPREKCDPDGLRADAAGNRFRIQ